MVVKSPNDILLDLDRMVEEMTQLRARVAAWATYDKLEFRPIQDESFFGIWADREDMQRLSTVEWLERLRAQQ